MLDKYLKIGLGLGSCSTIASVSYWSTQYSAHLPKFFYPQKSVTKQSSRLSNIYYKKIQATEKEVGCTFHVIFNPSTTEKNKIFSLLNEGNVNDDLLKQIADQIDSDADKTSITGFNIKNLKDQCKHRYDKKLRLAAIKNSDGAIELQARQKEQGRIEHEYID